MNRIFPTIKEYTAKSAKYNLIPVYKEYMVDIETPVSIFIKAGGLKRKMFLLESMEGIKKLSRYSFIGVSNSSVIKFQEGNFSVITSGKEVSNIKTSDPLKLLENFLKGYRLYKNPGLKHFVGGATGYLSYDMVKYFENINFGGQKQQYPEIMLYLTELVIVFDHYLQRMKIIATVKIDDDGEIAGKGEKSSKQSLESKAEKAYLDSIKKIEQLESEIFSDKKNGSTAGFPISAGRDIKKDFNKAKYSSNLRKQDFIDAVSKAKEFIINGEAFQVVLSQRFSLNIASNPFNVYRSLRTTNPSPYMYYFNFGNFKIIGSSPEPLIKITGRKILTCPIAGTKKRGANTKEERAIVNSLLNDEKETAEHNMLVDLSRNDLGRVCRFGTVKIRKYMNIEKYSHVMHLVSRIEGTLDSNSTIFDALKSTFPAGTLTGAPKIRAMQIISELEPDCRGPYGGVVGYIGYDGSLDTCITIRTAIVKGGKAYIQAGAGIVFDSVPENEWNETVNKASALFEAIRIAEQI